MLVSTERYTPACTRAQRLVEALIGGVLLNTLGKAAQNMALTKSGLVAKEVYLPQCGYTMYYHEREAVDDGHHKFDQDKLSQPTILLLTASLNVLKTWRALLQVWIFLLTCASFAQSRWATVVTSPIDYVSIPTTIHYPHII